MNGLRITPRVAVVRVAGEERNGLRGTMHPREPPSTRWSGDDAETEDRKYIYRHVCGVYNVGGCIICGSGDVNV